MIKEYIEVEKARDYIHNGDGTPMQKLFADLCVLNSPRATDVVEKEKFAKEIFTKLYEHIKYDGHTVSVWKNDLISIAKQYGVDLDCEAIVDRGK